MNAKSITDLMPSLIRLGTGEGRSFPVTHRLCLRSEPYHSFQAGYRPYGFVYHPRKLWLAHICTAAWYVPDGSGRRDEVPSFPKFLRSERAVCQDAVNSINPQMDPAIHRPGWTFQSNRAKCRLPRSLWTTRKE